MTSPLLAAQWIRSTQSQAEWCPAFNNLPLSDVVPIILLLSAVIFSLLDYMHLLWCSSPFPLLIFHFVELLSWLMPVPFRYHLWNSWWFLLGCFGISPRSSAIWFMFFLEFILVFWPLLFISFLTCYVVVFSMTTEGVVVGFANVQEIINFVFSSRTFSILLLRLLSRVVSSSLFTHSVDTCVFSIWFL